MRSKFVITKNVRNFISLMDRVQNLKPKVPKMVLVYGQYGLGKSEMIDWWAFQNDAVFVRAKQGTTGRWLLSDIAKELGEDPYWHIQENFKIITDKLREKKRTIIIDEVDYLLEKRTVETLRDLHDVADCPIVLVGMESVDKKLARFPHLKDRFYETFKLQKYTKSDIKQILQELTEVPFTDSGLEYLSAQADQFRQIIKLIDKVETLSETNSIKLLDDITLKGLLYERPSLETLQTTKQLHIA